MFLSSELQAAQIARSRQASEKHKEGNPVCQELVAICSTLSLSEPRGSDSAGVLSQIHDKVGLLNSSDTESTL